ncbi:MAG: PEGA domain-containing protein [Deltaproteobacteria bacterium]|nr:MAG: PEGA domain-containing protein [Deltaproteobacteria bacterium]
MGNQTTRLGIIILSLLVLFACEAGKKADLYVEVKATLDGKPAPQAEVLVDGVAVGVTDSSGHFSQKLQKQPGAEVEVAVHKEASGYRIEPWKDSFVTKLPKAGAVHTYAFKADLQATKYFTIFVADSGQPLGGASIRINGKLNAKTDENGEYVYEYKAVAKRSLRLQVAKIGYEDWHKTVRMNPGENVEVSLAKKKKEEKAVEEAIAKAPPKEEPEPAAEEQKVAPKKATAAAKPVKKAPAPKPKAKKVVVSVTAETDTYGVTKGLPGVVVNINDKPVGKTNIKGLYSYVYKGAPGKEVELKLTAPGYIPEEWETSVKLDGQQKIQRYFYPAKPKPIKVGLYGFVNNSPEEDLTEVVTRIESIIGNTLFAYSGFREVPTPALKDMMLQNGLDMETAATRGWQNTALINSVDLIIAGSVTREDQEITVETTVITADGNIILSQINKARQEKYLKSTAKVIANSIIDQFPFEGTIAGMDDDGYRINLGTRDYKIRRGNEFRYMKADLDASGRVKAYREAGTLRVIKTDDTSSWAKVAELNENEEVKIGDKVVRRIYLEAEREAAKASFILAAKGGSPADLRPLWGVNVYLNNTWVGTTSANGKVEIPIRLYDEYEILLSRHGYQPVRDMISLDQDKQVKEFALEVANAVFKVESEPSGANVFVDGTEIGKTPLLDGHLVNFGFRKIKLTVGGDYRDWEKVMEFNQHELDRTGENKIIFLKDYLKIGNRAEQNGNIDAAIKAYALTERANPDYSNARHRLAQLYMDEKNDYDSAIREFEKVLALPENQQVIRKQFAVTFTNLGHAYYEKGNQLIRTDRKAAAKHFGKAIKNLRVAKQNTRFFPNRQFDEAVHDTYYYMAISYHKLYLVTKNRSLIDKADLAWREYFDFFPKKLEADSNFVKIRNSAKKYWVQVKDLKS